MQKVLTAAQIREVDRLTTERYGIQSIILMENAAHAVVRAITQRLDGSVRGKRILILCGKGNNGGDGFAVARILWNAGATITVLLMFPDNEIGGDAKQNLNILRGLQSVQGSDTEPAICLAEVGTHHIFFDRLDTFFGPEVIVDAIFGTGLVRPLDGDLSILAKQYNSTVSDKERPLFLSIDIPSGLNSDGAEPIGEHFRADITVGFTAAKPANILPPASRSNGELIISNIGSPRALIDEQPSQLYVAERSDAVEWLGKTAFSEGDFKNKRGHSLIVAGSASYSGAAVLAGNAAMRSGVGLVTVATPRSSADSVASHLLPEVMVRAVAETENGAIAEMALDEMGGLLEKSDSLAIGCGLSQDESTKRFVERVLSECGKPVVVDADALNLLSPFSAIRPRNDTGGSDLILTPHEGEFLRLLGTEDKDPIKDRVAVVRNFAVEFGVILVLKGERVLIGSPDGRVVVNPTGNSGLGKAGNGDTLAGILAGFTAQGAKMGIDTFETVVVAVFIAGMAGDIAEMRFGKRVMTASDVRECLTEVFNELRTEKK